MNGERAIEQGIYELQGPIPKLAQFGKKAYKIINDSGKFSEGKYFKEKCPCCGDDGFIMHNGFKVRCSVCGNSRNGITIRNWAVREYTVCEILLRGPDVKRAYGNNKKYEDYPCVKMIRGFSRVRAGYDNVEFAPLPIRDEEIDPTPATFEKRHDITDYAFTTKEAAEQCCRLLIEAERKKLRAFNEEFGTNHVFPY